MEYDSRPSGSTMNPLIAIVGGLVAVLVIAAVVYFVVFSPNAGSNNIASVNRANDQENTASVEQAGEKSAALDPDDWRRGFRIYQQNYVEKIANNLLSAIDGHEPDTFYRLFDGHLRSAPGHDGYEGIVSLYVTPTGRKVVRLHGDYNILPTPGLTLTLTSRPTIRAIGDITTPFTVSMDIGQIEDFSGDTHFLVPDNLPTDALQSIALWSKPYNLLVASATLAPY